MDASATLRKTEANITLYMCDGWCTLVCASIVSHCVKSCSGAAGILVTTSAIEILNLKLSAYLWTIQSTCCGRSTQPLRSYPPTARYNTAKGDKDGDWRQDARSSHTGSFTSKRGWVNLMRRQSVCSLPTTTHGITTCMAWSKSLCE
jgi:hypothetical protein